MALFFLLPLFGNGQTADSIDRKTSFAIYPAFGYTPETNFIIGPIAVMTLKSRDESQTEFTRQSTFTPLALYTFRNQFLTELNLEYYFRSGHNLNLSPGYYVFPDFYFGLGNDNDPEISESYLNRFSTINGQFYFPVNSTFFVGMAFDFNTARLQGVESGGMLETDNPMGIQGGTLLGLGPAMKLDSRDNSIYPINGNLFSFQALITEVGDFSYTSALLDLRKYVTIRNEKNVVALQFASRTTTGGNIPFYKLPQLGGDNQLRGISNASLYRDRQMFFSQVEYRRHIWWRFGMVAFAGFGDVANQWSDLDFSELKFVGGLGYRFQVVPNDKINLRIDFGVSQNGQTGIYVGMQEAF